MILYYLQVIWHMIWNQKIVNKEIIGLEIFQYLLVDIPLWQLLEIMIGEIILILTFLEPILDLYS